MDHQFLYLEKVLEILIENTSMYLWNINDTSIVKIIVEELDIKAEK